MEFNEVILNRHSVRRFADKPVDRAIVDQLIAVAQTAPSSKNCKSSGFMVVEDPDTIRGPLPDAHKRLRLHGQSPGGNRSARRQRAL